jgi:protein-L-isoaspartate(D-aspartate) O-methyltransferase
MRYDYIKTDEFAPRPKYERLRDLAAKDPLDGVLLHSIGSQEHLAELLREATLDNEHVNQQALDAICTIDRTLFFDWDAQPDYIKDRMVTPYGLMAPLFAEGQTIPSPHMVLMQASYLDLHDNQKILEIGAGSGYNAIILAAAAGPGAVVYTTEIRPGLVALARKNIAKHGNPQQINVVRPYSEELGLPEYAPFDRITTTVGITSTEELEELLDQVAVSGLLHIAIIKRQSQDMPDEPVIWSPRGYDDSGDIMISNPDKGFAKAAVYMFKKTGRNTIEYSITHPKASGPFFRPYDNQKV